MHVVMAAGGCMWMRGCSSATRSRSRVVVVVVVRMGMSEARASIRQARTLHSLRRKGKALALSMRMRREMRSAAVSMRQMTLLHQCPATFDAAALGQPDGRTVRTQSTLAVYLDPELHLRWSFAVDWWHACGKSPARHSAGGVGA